MKMLICDMWLRSKQRMDRFSDEELVGLYRDAGDMDALAFLFDKYLDLIFGVCMKYFKHAQDSEDGTMAVFEVLVVKLKTHEVKNFKSWLYVLTKHYCLQKLRQAKKTLTKDSEDILVQLVDEVHPDDVDLIERRENGLRDCIQKLPADQKRSVELFYFESKSYVEIAETLSVDKEKVRSFIQNGRRNLRVCMNKKKSEQGNK
jgi:RNA polymerase sigma factor (sigma-70 family)